jgi:hypothetical protein
MACLITSGLDAICGQLTVGGNIRVIAINREHLDISSITYDLAGSDINAITNFALTGANIAYEIKVIEDSIQATQSLQNGDNPASSKYFLQTLAFNIAGQSQEVQNFLKEAALSRLLFLVQAKTLNTLGTANLWLCVGFNTGLKASTIESGTGIARDDLAGAVVTFTEGIADTFRELKTADNEAFVAALLV